MQNVCIICLQVSEMQLKLPVPAEAPLLIFFKFNIAEHDSLVTNEHIMCLGTIKQKFKGTKVST